MVRCELSAPSQLLRWLHLMFRGVCMLFGCGVGCAPDEIHGVAILMPKADVATLDKVEQGYDKAWVSLAAYDGSSIDNAFVYVRQEGKSVLPPEQAIPSARYLNVLVSGAKAAGLNSAYIDKLAAHKVYEPSPATLARRAALPSPGALPEITVEELAKYDGNTEGLPVRVGVQGYVFECSSFFGRHKGRDITTRSLYQFRGLSLDDNDDRGRPPYPILSDIDASEPELREYMNRWLDHYVGKETGGPDDGPAVVVGYLKEFKEQQASGVTTWVCPEKK